MKEEFIINRVCNFFNLNKEELKKLKETKDLYSAISEMTGLTRNQVKIQIHGLSYNVGKEL